MRVLPPLDLVALEAEDELFAVALFGASLADDEPGRTSESWKKSM